VDRAGPGGLAFAFGNGISGGLVPDLVDEVVSPVLIEVRGVGVIAIFIGIGVDFVLGPVAGGREGPGLVADLARDAAAGEGAAVEFRAGG